MAMQTMTPESRRQQDWQQAILNSADFTIISTDVEGIIQTFNAGALQKLGYLPDEVIGKTTPAIIHDPQEVVQRAQALSLELGYPIEPGFEVFVAKARLGLVDENNWTYIRKDRSRFPVQLSVTALRDEAGNLTGFVGIGKDISQQQQIEQSLYESEARFSGAFHHASIGMALVSPEGKWLKVNTSVCDIVGYSKSELLNLTFQEITHPEDLELDLSYVYKLLDGEIENYQMEKRYIHKQGHEVWILLSVSLVRGEDHQPLYFVAQIQDINQRKQAEEALQEFNVNLARLVHERTSELERAYKKLQESEAMYQDLYENAPDMYVSVDAQTGQVSQCNQTLCDVLELKKDDILNRPILDLYHPDCHAQAAQAFQIFQETGNVQDAQLQLRLPNESKLEVSLNVRAVRDDQGKVLYSRSSWRDITERKRLEQQLQQAKTELEHRVQERTQQLQFVNHSLIKSQERLELAIEASGDGWWHWHIVDGNLEWSPQWSAMLGYEPEELTASYETWEALIHPDDFTFVIEKLNAHLNDASSPYAFDYRVRTKSGEWKWIANLGRVVEWNELGQPVRMAGLHHDIGDRKQAEERLLELNNELQRSNQELAQFAYVASHDLQEPLRTIKSFTELLARRYQGQFDEKADRYMNYITDGAARMQTLISDLLAYSRVGRMEMRIQPIDLGQIIERVQSDLELLINKRQVEFDVAPLPILSADPTLIQQLMQNLISNAIKYCDAEVPIVRIWSTKTNQDYTISVQDNGIGIDPQYAERIFIIFQRLHNRDTYSGTGIGLAICKKIIEGHKGRIWVDSQEGQGATFSFQIPVDISQ